MTDQSGIGAEQEAFTELAKLLYRLLKPGDTSIEYVVSATEPVGRHLLAAYNAGGKHSSPDGPFNDVPEASIELSDAMDRLRAASYREGAGTWFSARIVVTAEGGATAKYNYDEEPEWDSPLDPIAYVTDQAKFPRDVENQPEWLKQKLAEGRERLASR